jgi:hypothetical protein
MRTILVVMLMVVLIGCGGTKVNAPATAYSNGLELNPDAWEIKYSPGMPTHPAAAASGWYFDIPTNPNNSVHYITTSYASSAARGYISMTFRVNTTGSPTYNYQLGDPDNTCERPANVRLFLQRADDDLAHEFYRWWANPISYQLGSDDNSTVTLTVPLAPDQWSSVLGRFGNESAESLAAFQETLQHMGHVGMTFGGGCYFGHGVNVSNGTARFTLLSYKMW